MTCTTCQRPRAICDADVRGCGTTPAQDAPPARGVIPPIAALPLCGFCERPLTACDCPLPSGWRGRPSLI